MDSIIKKYNREWLFSRYLRLMAAISIVLAGYHTSPAQSPLCSSGPTTFCCEYISQLSINGVTRNAASSFTAGANNLGYYDYTGSSLTTMTAGQSYPVSVTVITDSQYLEYVKIWCDFNGNGVLSDAGEMVFDQNKTFTGSAVYSGNITIPTTAYNGDIYIRVMMVYSAVPVLCGSYSYGNTVDLKATITGGLTPRRLTVSTTGTGGVTSSPSGINTGSGQSVADFANGSVVSLTATATAPQLFTGWSGDASGTTNPLSVTMDAAKNITANFGVTNSAPTDIALSSSSINENVAANSTVGTLSSTDPNAGNTFTYSLVSGTGSTDNASFNISGNSLRITNSPNYESKNSYSVRIRTTDQGSLYYEEAFTITINNVNESPTDISLSASSLNENVPANTTIGTLSSTDPDAGNTFTYTLVAGTGDTDNASFNISGSSLRMTNSPDYETKSSYSVRIRTTDQGSLTYEEPLTITINDVAEAPMATTSAASGITSAAATLNGSVNANGLATTVTFEYGLTTGYGSAVTADESPVTGNSAISVSKVVTGLSAATTYHYRVKAVNTGGTTNGSDQSFTTAAVAPTVTTQAVSNISSATATGNGNITSLGAPNPTAYGICWNTTGTPTTANSKADQGAASSTGAFTASMTGLAENTTYYVRAYATNAAGTTYGNEVSFTTPLTSLSGSSGGISIAQNTPVYIASEAIVTGSTLNGAIVTIASNFSSDQDILGIDGVQSGTSGSISYAYDSSKGILTLTGDADVATYQSILRKVTYSNTSVTPNTTSRSVSISLNKALSYSGNGHYYEFVENSGITWTNARTAAEGLKYFGLKGYLATITSAEENAFCVSKLSGQGWIGASDETVEGTWRWVTGPENGNLLSYTNWNSNEPNNSGNEDYAHFLTSGKWNDYPNSVGSQITGYVVEYGGSAGDPVLDISDVVTVDIIAPVASAASKILSYSFQANWQTYAGATNYYLDVATNSSFTAMVPGYTGKDVGNVTTFNVSGLESTKTYYYRVRASVSSGYYSNTISLTTLNSISGSSGGTSVAQNTPVYIAPAAVVSGTTLNGAIVSINSNFNSGQDVLGIDGTSSGTSGSISYSYNSSNGILTLSGNADVATYQSILRKTTYTNTSATPNTLPRSVTISLNKALPYSTNGHYYEFISSSGITWANAKTAAAGLNYFGLQGYLATISSSSENDFCLSKLSGRGWIGATDEAVEGVWKWATGPEAGNSLTYTNWDSGQPDNWNGGEDYAHFYVTGKWNDLPNYDASISGYVVEYGGMPGDQLADISDEVTVNISVPVSTAATDIQSGSIQANWQSLSGAAAYYLDVATNSSFANIVSGYNNKNVGNVTTYKVEGLNPVTTYYYRVRATALASGYNSNTTSATTVKAGQTIAFNALPAKIYGDIDFAPGATASSELPVSYTTSDPGVATIVGGLIHIVGAGTCTIYADQGGNSTYLPASQVSQTLSVAKAELTVTADAQTKVYGEANPTLTFQYNGWKNSETETVLDTRPSASTTVDSQTDAGTHNNAISVSGGVDNNYYFTYVPANFTVSKATLTVTADTQTKEYGETNPTLTFQYSGWKNSDSETVLDTKPSVSTTVDLLTSVGTHSNAITLSGGVDNNYTFSYVAANFSVTKAMLTVTADAQTKVYGDANPTLTFQYSGWKNSDSETVLDTQPSASTTVDLSTGVGTYNSAITVSGGVDNNYDFTYVPANFTVTRAMLTVTADAKTKEYGEANPTLTFQYSGWKNSDSEIVLNTKPSVSTTVDLLTSVGTHSNAITLSGGVDDNYAFSYVAANFSVTKAMLTVTADTQTKVYGDANPTLTFQYSGWKNLDSETVLDTEPTISTPVNLLTNVGVHTNSITISGGVDNNYDFTYVPADFTVTKATLTVTADSQTKEYGETNPTLTFQYSGWKNSDSETVLDTKPSVSTTVDLLTSVGTHSNAITLSGGVDNNYAFSYVAADFTVTKAMLTVTADAQTKVYGDANPTLTFQYSGWKNEDGESVLDTKPTASTSVNLLTNVGSYTNSITVSGGSDNNYNFTYVAANFTVTKAMLTVSADAKTKVYGDANPLLTFQYNGWKNSDTDAVLDTKPSASTTITELTAVGVYSNKIIVSGGIDNNYNFTYVPANFTVTKATLTIRADAQTKVYGDSNPILTFRYSGWKNNDNETVLDATPSASTTVNLLTTVGIYNNAITVSDGADTNYDFTYFSAGFTVTKAMLTVTADAKTKEYGEANPVLTFQYSGWKNADGETLLDTKPSVSTTVDLLTGAGIHNNGITVSGGADNNYDFTYVPADFTVTKARLTVTADSQTKVYGETNPTLTFRYSGWKNDDSEAVLDTRPSASITVGPLTNVGMHSNAITLSGGIDNNYDFTYVPAHFTITKAMLTVTADAKTKEYGEANPALTFQYSGWKNTDSETVLDTKPSVSTTVNLMTGTGIHNNVITVSGGVDNNYDFTYIPAHFTVTKAVLTVTADAQKKVYGEANSTLTFHYSGWKNADTEAMLDSKPTVSTTVDQKTGVGVHSKVITVSGGADNDYDFSYVPADFEITRALLTIEAEAQNKVYDGTTGAGVASAKLVGVRNGDTVLLTIGSASFGDKNVGNGKAVTVVGSTISGTGAGNYTLSEVSGLKANITPKQLTVANTSVVTNKMFDNLTTARVENAGTLQGLVPADVTLVTVTAVASYNNAAAGKDKVITTVFTISGSASGNYIKPADLIINGAKISEKVNLSETLEVPVMGGCQGEDLYIGYKILKGTPTDYQITFNAAALAAGFVNTGFLPLPSSKNEDKLYVRVPANMVEGVYSANLQFRNELNDLSPVYTFVFTIKLSKNYIVKKFNDVILCDNSTKRFTSYQWYKNGQPIPGATGQFYNEKSGLDGFYSLQVNTKDGAVLWSCEQEIHSPKIKNATISAYPNPAISSEPFTVKINDLTDQDLEGAVMRIYNIHGALVQTISKVRQVNSVKLPFGEYIGTVITSDQKRFNYKITVVNF